MGDEFVAHLEALAAKLQYVGQDDTARFSAAYRWVLPGQTGCARRLKAPASCLHLPGRAAVTCSKQQPSCVCGADAYVSLMGLCVGAAVMVLPCIASSKRYSTAFELEQQPTCPRSSTVTCRDVAPELERLKLKAVARCREHLMQRIYDMRRPKTNLQVVLSDGLRTGHKSGGRGLRPED